MNFLKTWAVAVVGVAFIASIFDVIQPNGAMKKYVNLALGTVISLTLISPFLQLKSGAAFENIFNFEYNQGVLEETQKNAVLKAFEENLKTDIFQKTGFEADVVILEDDEQMLKIAEIIMKNVPVGKQKEVENELEKNYGDCEKRFN